MIDNSPIGSHNNFEKKSNPFRKIISNVKSFMKKDGEVNRQSSFEISKTEKNSDSDIPKSETYKKREVKRSKHVMRANKNEQKLPAKFKKGW